jgi:hypothetical protein
MDSYRLIILLITLRYKTPKFEPIKDPNDEEEGEDMEVEGAEGANRSVWLADRDLVFELEKCVVRNYKKQEAKEGAQEECRIDDLRILEIKLGEGI